MRRAGLLGWLLTALLCTQASAATISGDVTTGGATPVANVCVFAIPSAGGGVADQEVTDVFGHYELTVGPASYKVLFRHCPVGPQTFALEYWGDTHDFQLATPIDVSSANATGISPDLAPGRTISGRLTSNGSDGIEGLCVGVYDESILAGGFPPHRAFGSTDADGDYTTDAVPTNASYRVQFNDCRATPVYLTEWYDNALVVGSSTPVPVAGDHVGGIDATLVQARIITGTVTPQGGGAGIEGICVNAEPFSMPPGPPPPEMGLTTKADGSYRLLLPEGEYKLQIFDCRGPSANLQGEWWDDTTFENADKIDLTGANVSAVANAQLAPQRTISGTVTPQGGGPGIQGICVSAQEANTQPGPGGPPVGGTQTQSGGSFSLVLPEGQYKLQFSDCRPSPGFLGEWWNDKAGFGDANVINLTGANVSAIADAQLAQGRTITGTVTPQGGGAGIQGICVNAQDADAPPGPGSPGFGTGTQPGGGFSLVLPAGRYKLQFFDCRPSPSFLGEWWNDKQSFAAANVIDLTGSNMSAVADAQLAPGRTITGTVTPQGGGAGIQGICVNAQDADAPPGTPPPPGSGTQTGPVGGFSLVLPAGRYKLQFSDCRPSPSLLGEWWDDKQSSASANVIDLTGASMSAVADAQLTPGRTITGTVTPQGGGAGIQGICVNAQDADAPPGPPPDPGFGTQTGPVGGFSLVLPAGRYKLQFSDCRPSPSLLGEWWDDKQSSASANVIDLTGANVSAVADAQLSPGRTITGTVTPQGGGAGIQGICVNAQDADAPPGPGSPGFGTGTQPGGGFSLVLPAGRYKLQFSDCRPSPSLLGEWWDDKQSSGSANVIDMTGANVSAVANAQLAQGRTITGIVTPQGGGAGIQGICVNAQDTSAPPGTPPPPGFGTGTRMGGTYVLVLPAGQYKLQFSDCRPSPSLLGEWFNDKPSSQTANVIDLTGANMSAVADAQLSPGRTISGTVTPQGGGPGIQGICVNAQDADALPGPPGGPGFGTQTGPVGGFSLVLPEGDYKLQFSDCRPSPNYLGEWFNDKPSSQTANVIDLTGANMSAVADAQLSPGRTISGTVTPQGGGPGIQGICVNAQDADTPPGPGSPGFKIGTQPGGTFTLVLPAGRYKLRFSDCRPSPSFLGEWWNDKASFGDANVIDLTGANMSAVANAQLSPGRTISGTVTPQGGGSGIQGICVDLYSASGPPGEEELDGRQTDAQGAYTFLLPAGSYKVRFRDECRLERAYLPEYYSSAATWEAAVTIDLQSNQSVTADAQLEPGRMIRGRVTSDGTTAIPNVCVSALGEQHDEQHFGSGYTGDDPEGDYAVVVPPSPGRYKLRFDDCNETRTYVGEYWDGVAGTGTLDFAAAHVVNVVAGDVTGVNVVLAPGNKISGRVTIDGTATGIPGVCVTVVQAADETVNVAGGESDTDGNYTTDPAPPGPYRVRFDDCSPNTVYISEWFDGAVDFGSAATVDLSSGNQTETNAGLAVGGGITGTVREGAGSAGPPLATICVDAGRTGGPGAGFAQTGPDGTYRIGGLRSGRYDINFSDCRADQSDGSYTGPSVEGVDVTAPADMDGVDGHLDNSIPNTFITSGPSGNTDSTTAVFAFAADEPGVSFECRLDAAADWQPCTTTLTGLSVDEHTLAVRATDFVGHVDASPASRTWTVVAPPPPEAPPLPQETEGSLPPEGGTVSSDSLDQGPTQADPVTTAVTAPAGGEITITEQPASEPPPEAPPAGYTLLGQQVVITSTVTTTAAEPLRIVFTVDEVALGGTPLADIAVLRNNQPVGECPGSAIADPDPCIGDRRMVGTDAQLTVLTSQASTWTVVRPPKSATPDPMPTPGPSPTPAAPPVVTSPAVGPSPRVLTTRIRATSSGKIAIRVACAGATCRGSISLRAKFRRRGKTRIVTLGPQRFTIRAAATRTVTLRLSRSQLTILRRARTLRATATIRLEGAGSTTATVAIRAPRRSG